MIRNAQIQASQDEQKRLGPGVRANWIGEGFALTTDKSHRSSPQLGTMTMWLDANGDLLVITDNPAADVSAKRKAARYHRG